MAASTPLPLHDSRDRWPLWLFCLLAAPLLVNRLGPEFLDADTLLSSLMSTQKVTLFYWGQERLANVLPFMLAPVTDLARNQWLQMTANAAAYLLLLEALTHVACQLDDAPPPRLYRHVLFALLVALPFLFLRPFALYQFTVAAQPYSLSFLCLTWAALAWRRRVEQPLFWVACGPALVVAVGLNPAVLLLVVALVAWQHRAGKGRGWIGFFVLTLSIFVVWTFLSVTYPLRSPASFMTFAPQGVPAALRASAGEIAHEALRLRVVALGGIAVTVAWPQLGLQQRRATLSAIALGFVWSLFFLTNLWVQRNSAAFRYFMPLIFAPVVCTALALAHLCFQRRTVWRARVALLACTLVFAGFCVRPWTPLASYHLFQPARTPLATAQRHQIRYFAGDYWTVWPVIFQLRLQGHDALGAFSRGIAMQAEIMAALHKDQIVQPRTLAQCINKPLPTCQEQLEKVTRTSWRLADVPPEGESIFLTPATPPL